MASVSNSVVEFMFKALNLQPQSGSALMAIIAAKEKSSRTVAALPAFTLLLNLVKAKVEMTYELVMSLQTSVIDGDLPATALDEWEGLLSVVSECLEFLKGGVSAAQQHMIMDMQASFYGSTGQ